MARRQEIAAVYAAAVIQGIVLVAFPALSAIFTSPAHYGLSTTQYGGLFIPQAIAAILSSLLGAGLTSKISGKGVLLLGLAADLLSMTLLYVSQFAVADHMVTYMVLLAATGCLGIGFGFTVPALNTFTAAFFPEKIDTAILTLNALLGLGTALAPIFAIIFVGQGIWWGLPLLMSALTLALLLFSLRLPLKEGAAPAANATKTPMKMPVRFWVYAAFALVYGVCETLNGNWASIYMSNGLGASVSLASLALTIFWVMVTAGRVLFAVIETWCPPSVTYRGLPILLAAAFFAIAWTPRSDPVFALVFFGIAGLGCSALLPLVISFGQTELKSMAASVAGGLIGFYQMGYGLAAFGVGPLQEWAGLSLRSVYDSAIFCAIGMAVLAFVIVRRSNRPA